MKRTSLLLFALLIGCKTSPEELPITKPKAETKTEVTKPQETLVAVEVLPFDEAKAKEYAFKGTLKTGAMWKDRNGNNILILSQTQKDAENGKFEEILGYHYTSKAGKDSLLWQTKDWAENPCDEAPGVQGDVVVKDLNNDGIAENAFVYGISGNCDVSPREFKLIMHSGATKYAIRGNTRVALPPDAFGGDKKFDAAFNTAPPSFKAFASELWDKTIKPMDIKM